MRQSKAVSWALGAALVLGMSGVSLAQQGGGPGGGAGGGGGRGGWGNPQQMQERMLERVKTELKATDEEWAALKPKVQKVQDLQRQEMMARFAGRGGRGGPGAENQNQPSNPIAEKAAALRTTLANDNATADQIKAALDALRDAKKTVDGQIKAAQDDLKSLLTVRQEAVLVEQGILE